VAILLFIDWERFLDKYGWPALGLGIVGYIIWKAVWPYVKQYLDDTRNERIEAQRVLRERALNLEKREEQQLAGFTDALEKLKDTLEANSRRQETQISMMEQTLMLVKDNNDIARGRR
jgi:hypothetical protein